MQSARVRPRVVLMHRAYDAPVATAAKFDLIVLSYSLSMINPGFDEVLRICKTDLRPAGIVAVVDFHNTLRRRRFCDQGGILVEPQMTDQGLGAAQ